MDLNYSEADLKFRDEVRAFLKENLTEKLMDGVARTPGVFIEPDIGSEWHKIMHKPVSYTHLTLPTIYSV